MNWKTPLSILLLLGAACSDKVESNNAASSQPTTPSKPEVVAANQYQLAREIYEAERQPTEDARARSLTAIGDAWRGKRYTWSSFFVPAFCPSPQRCHVIPFDRGDKDSDIVQGWSPRLEISPDEWKKLGAHCKAQDLCEIRFEGTLAKFKISTVDLTSLAFVDVQVLSSSPETLL